MTERARARAWASSIVLILLPGLALGAASPAQKCAAAKNKLAMRHAAARAKCFQNAFLAGTSADSSCLSTADLKFATGITKIESKGGCSRVGDTAALQSAVESCVADVVALTQQCSGCTPTPTPTATPTPPAHFCDLPGSVHFTESGPVVIPGGDTSNLLFLHLPTGFCAHAFGNVGNAHQLRFAPGGEAFVASPTTPTTDTGPNGQSAIVVLADDNGDGLSDTPSVFKGSLPSTQGLLFANSFLYYQDGTKIMRVPYASGDRTPSGASTEVADIDIYTSSLNWPKYLDMAEDGTIYVTNSGDQAESCVEPHPFRGGILKLDGTPGGTPVAQGLRLPGGLRCAPGFNQCFATENTRDYSAANGGRSKLVPVRQGDDWGFACCASRNVPFADLTMPVPDCSGVSAEDVSFAVSDRPGDLDFSPATWPSPWNGRAFVAMEGETGSWAGARLVAVGMDAMLGGLLPGSTTSGSSSGSVADFATGWDDNTLSHGRPYTLSFSDDGRLFVGNLMNGDIVWIAPLDLAYP